MKAADDPHAGGAVVRMGAPIESASAVVIAIHGRGASPRDILSLTQRLNRPDVAFLAPAAAGNSWYPYSFLSETTKNEPLLTSALRRMSSLVDELDERDVSHERIVFLGFSQGACLSAEFVVRHARRWGGVIVLSGGLIGPPGTTWNRPGTLDDTPIFVGCSDIDTHIPKDRVEESVAVLTRMGGLVTSRFYAGMGHTVNEDELEHARQVIDAARTNG
jgi:phospholipase/carboxylesterase